MPITLTITRGTGIITMNTDTTRGTLMVTTAWGAAGRF